MLGKRLVTHQTGPAGVLVRKVLVEETVSYKQELYLGITLNRQKECPVLLASSSGGVEIEEVSRLHPEKIFKEEIDPVSGLHEFQARRLVSLLKINKNLWKEAVQTMLSLYGIFEKKDCSLIEINPWAVRAEEGFVALDAKFNFDDNGLYRHPDISGLRDVEEEDPLETEARQWGLSYIKLDGNIGCLVNGAGLAMATLDLIKMNGGEPANFLDVGGGASIEQVSAAFKLILKDTRVRVILINIFGGIMKCDVIAEGVIEAVQSVGVHCPVVVRLEGTNVTEGREMLMKSGVSIIPAESLEEAAGKVAEVARI
jgi:succinyl-CoA synthetase beta subunit